MTDWTKPFRIERGEDDRLRAEGVTDYSEHFRIERDTDGSWRVTDGVGVLFCGLESEEVAWLMAKLDKTGEKTMAEILTPESPRWEQFTDMLGSMEWCDGDAGAHVHRYAKAVMAAMGGIDIEATLAFFESHGGYCDCEILLNVDPW